MKFHRNFFRSGLKETLNSTISISNTSAAVFKEVLSWYSFPCKKFPDVEFQHFRLYSGTMNFTEEVNAVELLEAADCYDLFGLKQHCQSKLIEAIDTENVLTLLHASEIYKVTHLMLNMLLQKFSENS